MKMAGIMAILVAVIMATTALAGAGLAEPEEVSQIVFEQGETDWIDGGHYVGIHAPGMDFRVIYGTQDKPRDITIVSSFVRYLGAAEVYNTDGDYKGEVAIPVVTMTAQRLSFLAEFRDVNENSMMDADVYLPDRQIGGEVIKTASLRTVWNLTIENETHYPDGSTGWNFTLTATDIPYIFPTNETNGANRVLDKVEFTFHLRAGIKDVEIERVPWYTVEVYESSHGPVVVESSFKEYRNYTGTAVNASVKYDHLIEGWDFEGNNTKLVLGTGLIMGNHIPQKTEDWIETQFISKIGGEGHINASDESGNVTIDGNYTRPTLIKRNEMNFEDNWERVGRFTWVSNITLTDKNGHTSEGNVTFAVRRAERIDHINLRGDVFRGFMVWAGFIYPSADSIYHDPYFSAVAYSFDIGSVLNEIPAGLLLAQMAIGGAIVIGAMGYRKVRKERTQAKNSAREAHNPSIQMINEEPPHIRR